MVVYCADEEDRSISLNVGTGIRAKNGKAFIYCELSYHDKKSGKEYNRTFPATKFDEVSNRFHALYNRFIPAAEIPSLFK
jgi:hypothetical protein